MVFIKSSCFSLTEQEVIGNVNGELYFYLAIVRVGQTELEGRHSQV
jgi:hypothetical protein